MSRYNYADPSTDHARCDALSEEDDFECAYCQHIQQDDAQFPYCSPECASRADGENDEDERDEDENPRERDDDDGRTYSDPRDEREERFNDD